jgi:flagellar basal-body rod protein FlgF
MDEVMAVSLRSMQHDIARVERLSSNLANALTPGYKREVLVQRPETSTLAGASFAQAIAREAGAVEAPDQPALQVLRDMRGGTLKSTNQALDVALAGAGFFEVLTDTGPAYTRQGQFQVDARGRLVTLQGHPVMGTGGEIVLSGAQPSIDANGVVSENGRAVGQLKVVDFDDARSLQRLDGGLFAAGASARLLSGADVQTRQGFVENANVNTMHEMVQLIQTMRHFESTHRVVPGYDDMLGSAIRKLGAF